MKIVVIGAGQTGRGLIAPILKENKFEITFLDKNQELINQLNEKGTYEVAYFGAVKESVHIDNFKAFHVDSVEAIEAIKSADLVTTSVFAQQIESLIPLFEEGIKKREKSEKLMIICIENGVHVKKPLVEANLDAYIAEGIIFCTSIRDSRSLKITSEANIDVPIDGKSLPCHLEIVSMPLDDKFQGLIQRKIYTYNFVSAVVAYLGSYQGYESYAEAAKDNIIKAYIKEILIALNKLIADKFNIDIKEQTLFSARAIAKFENKDIYDSIVRNAQQAKRKLGNNERLLTPVHLSIVAKQEYYHYLVIIAAALYYGYKYEELDVKDCLKEIEECLGIKGISDKIDHIYQKFEKKENLASIIGGKNEINA